MPASKDEAEKQMFNDVFAKTSLQLLDKINNHGKISSSDILTVWNNYDTKKLNLLVASFYDDTNTYYAVPFALNNTKYAKAGSNKIKGLTDCLFFNINELVFALTHTFDHVEKEPYVTIPIQHN